MRIVASALLVCASVCLAPSSSFAQSPAAVEYRVLATNKTSTMQKEMQEAAQAGFRFGDVMGGDTAFGGSEVVVIMVRDGSPGGYRLPPAGHQQDLDDAEGDAGGR